MPVCISIDIFNLLFLTRSYKESFLNSFMYFSYLRARGDGFLSSRPKGGVYELLWKNDPCLRWLWLGERMAFLLASHQVIYVYLYFVSFYILSVDE